MAVPSLSSGPFPAREGHIVRPLVDGVPFFSRLYDAFCAANTRIWFVAAFVYHDFRFPQGPTLWDTLDACARRGVDVRVLFWHNPSMSPSIAPLLQARSIQWRAQWDSSLPDVYHCHHHKFWLIDPGTPGGFAFIGGMNFGFSNVDRRTHDLKPRSRHDVCLEVHGPCVDDLVVTFRDHWHRRQMDPTLPSALPEATRLPELEETKSTCQGDVRAQILRTRAGHLFLDKEAEDSIFQQLLLAIQHAQESIYIENQHPGEESLLHALSDAAKRGVQIVYLVPAEPMGAILHERNKARAYAANPEGRPPRYASTFAALDAFGALPGVFFGALATPRILPTPHNAEIYIHAKLCIVDGEWLTCGSANFVDLSMLPNHTECNIALWSREVARDLLRDLVEEHTHRSLSDMSMTTEWLGVLRACAWANDEKRARGELMEGHVYSLDARAYPEHSS